MADSTVSAPNVSVTHEGARKKKKKRSVMDVFSTKPARPLTIEDLKIMDTQRARGSTAHIVRN